jgi:hypothetical protein
MIAGKVELGICHVFFLRLRYPATAEKNFRTSKTCIASGENRTRGQCAGNYERILISLFIYYISFK